MSRKRLIVMVSVVFLTAGGLYILGFRLKDVDWGFIYQVSTLDILLILALSFASIGLYTLEVFLLLAVGGYSVSFLRTYLVLSSSMSANYVTPVKVGIPLRIFLYREYFKIAVGSGSAVVAVETLLGLFIPAGLSVIGIRMLFPEINIYIPIILMSLVLIAVCVLLFPSFFELRKVLNYLFSAKTVQRLEVFLGNLNKGMRKYSLASILLIIVVLMLNLLVTSYRLFIIVKILGGNVPFGEVFFTRMISVTAGSASMIPMGLGVRDASVTFLLTSLGAAKEVALTSALIERVFSPGFPLLLGLISANILGVKSLKEKSGPDVE